MRKILFIILLAIALQAIISVYTANAEEYVDLYNPDKCTTSEYVDADLSGYSVYEGKAYFRYCIIEGMDPKTIKPLVINGEESSSYGQDKNNVYYQTRILKGLEPNKFNIKNIGRYGVILYDNNTVYFDGTDITNVNPDIETLKEVGGFYYSDKNFLYQQIITDKTPSGIENFTFKKIEGGDPNNFKTGYNITPDAVYWYGKKIEGADPGSFETPIFFDNELARDKNNVYYKEKIMYGMDVKSFQVYSIKVGENSYESYSIDKNRVYDIYGGSSLYVIKKKFPSESRKIDQSLSSAISTYESKYPSYTPQPAVPAPGSPEEAELKKFQEEVVKAQQEEVKERKQNMIRGGVELVGILLLGGIGYGIVKSRKKSGK